MTAPTLPIAEKDRPDYQSSVVKRMLPDLEIVRDIAAGQRRMLDKSTAYLPQHPKEQAPNYIIRLKRPTFFNAFLRTLDGLVGMVFRVAPKLGEDVPEPITQHWENIDKEGTHGEVFLKTVFADALEAGHCAIFVDYPAIPAGVRPTLTDERQLALRPYWIHVQKEDILNFRTSRAPGGERVLEHVTLRVGTHEADGAFGDKLVVRYRVYQRVNGQVQWSTWQRGEDGKAYPLAGQSGVIAKLDRIPLVFVYGRRVNYGESTPPLLDLAYLNILHYQTTSDFYHALHIGLVPVFTVTGGPKGEVEWGPNAYLNLPQGATAGFTETSGNAFGAADTALKRIETRMAVMGLSLLQPETRAAETAQAKRLDRSEKDSALSTAARALQDAAEEALGFHAQFLGLPDGGSVTVNQDFLGEGMEAPDITVLSDAVSKGQLSLETMWQKLQEGEWLPDDFDPEVEKQRLQDSGMIQGAAPSTPQTGTVGDMAGTPKVELVATGNPYDVVTDGNRYCVVKKATGERLKCYPTKEAAMAYFRALEANVKDA